MEVVTHAHGRIRTFGSTDQGSVFARALYVRAGTSGNTVQVAPQAIARLRCVDADSGHAIPGVNYSARPVPGFEAWPDVIVPDSKLMVAAGRTTPCHWSQVPTGERVQTWLSFRWPIPKAHASTLVYAYGFKPRHVQVPLVPVGRPSEPMVVRLRRFYTGGSLEITVKDERGGAVGPMNKWVFFSPPGELPGHEHQFGFPVRFDEGGSSAVFPVRSGSFTLRSRARAEDTQWFESVPVEIREGETSHVDVVLSGAAVLVEFVDTEGRRLDDVGYRFSRDATVSAGVTETARGRRISGFLLVRPGLGHVPPRAYVGWNPGTWVLHAYRHGYEDLQLPCNLVAGCLTRVIAEMHASPGTAWARALRR